MKANTLPLTPIENFNVVSIGEIPEIDIDKYELRIEGLVEKPLTLKYSDLLSRPSVKRIVMLKCVGGWSGIGEWTGIPLNELFNEVKIMRNARTVVFYSADGYSTSLSIVNKGFKWKCAAIIQTKWEDIAKRAWLSVKACS